MSKPIDLLYGIVVKLINLDISEIRRYSETVCGIIIHSGRKFISSLVDRSEFCAGALSDFGKWSCL